MSGFLRKSFIFLLSAVYLVGCGGSGVNDSGTSPGTGGTPPVPVVTVKFVDAAGAAITQVTPTAPARVIATATLNGAAIVGSTVSFALKSDIGSLSQASATTNASGVAEVQLLAGTKTGSAEVKASITVPAAAESVPQSIDVKVGSTVASLELLASSVALPSSNPDGVELTAVVKNSDNVGVKGVKVVFSSSSGQLAVNDVTEDGSALTDVNGLAKAILKDGGDKANRAIVIKATTPVAAALSDEVTVNVTETKLTISPLNGDAKTTIAKGDVLPLTISLADSLGVGIPNQDITVTSSLGNTFTGSLKTNANGVVSVSLTGVNSGADTITAKAYNGSVSQMGALTISAENIVFKLERINAGNIALGVPANMKLTWQNAGVGQNGNVTVSATRGSLGVLDGNGVCQATPSLTSLPVASGSALFCGVATDAGPSTVTASVADGPTASVKIDFIATQPKALELSASPTTIAPDGETSTVMAVVRDDKSNLVTGATVQFTLADVSGGSLSSGSAVTDLNGRASVVYTSRSTSAVDGVIITAAVGGADSKTVNLTVARRNLFITFGTGNEIIVDSVSYTKEFLVFVTDADSAPRPDVELTLAAPPVAADARNLDAFMKGRYVWNGKFWSPQYAANCKNEDLDRDGVLDPTEDTNNDGKLTPGNVVAVTAADGTPGKVKTGADGSAIFKIRYPKQFGNWVRIDLQANTLVGGTESSANSVFVLPVASVDVNQEDKMPPGVPDDLLVISPFGKLAGCNNPN